MNPSRLEQLRAMLAEEPGDAFIRYAIALEMKHAGDMQEAVNDLCALITEDPTYIACYYQLALILADLGRLQEAADTCEAGALQCLVTGDHKARAELIGLKDVLLGEA